MRIHFPTNLIASGYSSCKLTVLFLWIFGFLSGVVFAAPADHLVSLMRACCDAGVSIVGLFFVPFLPFLISAAAVFCSAPLMFYFTFWGKSFLLGFSLRIVHAGFTGGGWLICLLLFFTDILTAPILLLFGLRHADCRRKPGPQEIAFAMIWFAVVCTTDYLWVVPLLREII